MKDDWWLTVKDFTESDKDERIVTFSLPKQDRKKLADYPEILDKTITCHLIKIEPETGETEILRTSLTDMEKYEHIEFDSLYHYRRNEEEAYQLLIDRIELENFSGKTSTAIKQDFYAKILLMTLCAAYAHPIEEKLTNECKADQERKYDQKINRTNALAMTQEILISVILKNQ